MTQCVYFEHVKLIPLPNTQPSTDEINRACTEMHLTYGFMLDVTSLWSCKDALLLPICPK